MPADLTSAGHVRRPALLALGLVVLAIAASWAAALPPAARVLAPPPDPLVMRGSLHVHTRRSDGTGTVEDVARAARAAGLQFVVFADHGDATRAPDPPVYREGVLCIDAVEISADGGHYLALGLGKAPYRLAGEPRDVVEDVRRLGGFGIVAHPESPKADLQWRDWSVPFDGVEWLNADSEWRDEPRRAIVRALAAYAFRAPETIAAMFDRPVNPLARWDAAAGQRPVVGVAGHDAHARIGLRGNWEPAGEERSLRLPSYQAAFEAFTVAVRLDTPVSGDPGRDAAAVLQSIGAGRLYTTIEGIAGPAAFAMLARTSDGRVVGEGEELESGVAADIEVRCTDTRGVSLTLYRNGRVVASAAGPLLRYSHLPGTGPAVYRAEASLPGAPGTPPVPWVVGNHIAIGRPRPPAPMPPPPPSAESTVFDEGDAAGWRVERDPRSRGDLAVVAGTTGGRRLQLSYALAPGVPSGQYAALVAGIGQGRLDQWRRVSFSARASSEMRIAVQLRVPTTGARWLRSVVVHGGEPRTIVVPFDDMRPVDAAPQPIPLAQVDSLLFVVDTTHATPGSNGTFSIDDVRLERD